MDKVYMRNPDANFLGYLERLPKLGNLVVDSESPDYQGGETGKQWVIGRGYQPFDENNTGRTPRYASKHVGRSPDLPISMYSGLAQSSVGMKPAESSMVDNCGFEAGFNGARVLVPQGFETSQDRLRAAYCDEPLTFRNTFMAITVPEKQEDRDRAKVLAAILNSRVAVYFAFYGTLLFGSEHSQLGKMMTEMNVFHGVELSGSERHRIEQADLLRFPFPSPADLPDPNVAAQAERDLVDIMDSARIRETLDLVEDDGENEILRRIDQLVYRYFCLSDNEIVLIEDTAEAILPAFQSRNGAIEKLWHTPDKSQRKQYGQALVEDLSTWFNGGVGGNLVARNDEMAILRLCPGGSDYSENEDVGDIEEVKKQISDHAHRDLDLDSLMLSNSFVFADNYLYMMKPMQARFWLRSTAFADTFGIAFDIQNEIDFPKNDVSPGQQGSDGGTMIEPD